METSQLGQSEGPPYPSFKELEYEEVRVFLSPATERLFWELDGVFPTAISVMKDERGTKDDLEPFFRPDTGTWHEISQLPVTEPKVSSLEASVYDLDQLEYDWLRWHEDHDAPQFGQEYVTYGDLDDDIRPYAKEPKEDGSWEEDSDTEFLVKCCGEDRPLRKSGLKLVVTASQSAGSESFVTIRDFVSAVHPWLISMRGDILRAKDLSHENAHTPAERYKWMVNVKKHCGGELFIQEKKEWIQDHIPYAHRPVHPMTPSLAAILAARDASRNR
ncbi:hypothetical protein NEUTE1DRAFT_148386 [Neurospora tetrasperma FGSC 2508]|uniref:Uncharacterized protein n=1 Tax=Neurospora tetrasperma (strain FGSC 2508 / ATCC MYA-4615 / P0657) TaxID=510951 RepID=F8MT42_NEUT8|nr:uncharacterized protein NEUTE1DRAFT_148386 [Neurospora tetrasperma FGSC 2508]EGO56024.1 hypothetical protein NEUTE1DRAFT_148386 [Neurospora tetrasperma FGSC 2508]EGZ68709.1 hypothetical protein NEUTE2DRAFT_93129 [Neurospora tetrasperma FGSC 2509]